MSSTNPPLQLEETTSTLLKLIHEYYSHATGLKQLVDQSHQIKDSNLVAIEKNIQDLDKATYALTNYIHQYLLQINSIEHYSLNTSEYTVVAEEYNTPISSNIPLIIKPLMNVNNLTSHQSHLPLASIDAALVALDKIQKTQDNYTRENLLHVLFLSFLEKAVKP